MIAELPPPYRLVAIRGGTTFCQGTAWFVTRSKVITAWHVIRDAVALADVDYQFEIGGAPLHLDYLKDAVDAKNDVAALQVRASDQGRVLSRMVLPLADEPPQREDEWHAAGFPEFAEGRDRTVSGSVENPNTSGRMQLYLREGTTADWSGISGSALFIHDRVAGIVTGQSQGATAFAAPCSAVVGILPELAGRTQRGMYREWAMDKYRAPGWSRAYSPRLLADDSTVLPADGLAELILARRGEWPVWLIAGDRGEGREAMLRSVAAAFAGNESVANDDWFDLPIWLSAPPDSIEPDSVLQLCRQQLMADGAAQCACGVEPVLAQLRAAIESGRALFVIDGADKADIEALRQGPIGRCALVAGGSESVAASIENARRYRIAPLTAEDRRGLAAYWGAGAAPEFGPCASPLGVSVWSRAEAIASLVRAGEPGEPGSAAGRAEELKALVESLLAGGSVADHPPGDGVESIELARRLLAGLAYLSLVDGVDEIGMEYAGEKAAEGVGLPEEAADPACLDQLARQSGILLMTGGETFRFTHAAVQEQLAASVMHGSVLSLNLDQVAEDAARIRDPKKLASWSRALALRLDTPQAENDAREILGTLLNYGLPAGSRSQLRNMPGPLTDCVCDAVLQTESMAGERLRRSLGWWEFPKDWTGYRPDEWRAIEELLRYLDGLTLRLPDERSRARLLARLVRNAKVIEVALIRYSLAKEIKKREQQKAPVGELERLYERERFFELAGRKCARCRDTKIRENLVLVPEGWFFMGAHEAEERSWPNERPQHRVLLDSYRLTRTEVTNRQYELFDPDHAGYRFAKDHPEDSKDGWESYPAVRVSWYEAWCFAEWMGLSLPTEAQWEKAARGLNFPNRPETLPDSPRPYWFGSDEDDLKNVARFRDNSNCHAWPAQELGGVGSKYRHRWNLGELCGNVWEWCRDEEGLAYTDADRRNPEAFERDPEQDVITNRVIRGGSFYSPPWNCRHAVRHCAFPTVRADTIGFRLCADSPARNRG